MKALQNLLKEKKGGYYMIMLVMVFAVVGILITTQVAKEAVKYRQIAIISQQNEVDSFSEFIANTILSRNINLKNGFYELGGTIDFQQEKNNELKASLQIPIDRVNDGWLHENTIKYDYISSSIVPVPTAYNFTSGEAKGIRPGSNGLNPNSEIKGLYGDKIIGSINAGSTDLGFYNPDKGIGADCDPEANWSENIQDGQLNYNIFKRQTQDPKSDFQALTTTNFGCDNVYLVDNQFKDNPYRTGGQTRVARTLDSKDNPIGKPNFYYTVPALGTGSAGTECATHIVKFNQRWSNSDEYVDPLDDPCNWNRLQSGQAVQIGLSSYNKEEIFAKEGRDFGSIDLQLDQPFSTAGDQLEKNAEEINKGIFYDPITRNDTLILRVRLRCSNGSVNCHPLLRYEFYDEFIDETKAGQVIDDDRNTNNFTYAPAVTLQNTQNTDFTARALNYLVVNDNTIFKPYDLFNQDQGLSEFFNERVFLTGNKDNLRGRRIFNSELSINKLRVTNHFSNQDNLFRYPLNNGLGPTHKRFSYDISNRISHIAVNNLGVSLQKNTDSETYKPLFDFNLNELDSPELYLQNPSGFVRGIARHLGYNDIFLNDYIEYQLVSSKQIGLDRAYVVAEDIANERSGTIVKKKFNDPIAGGGTVFSNVSN